MYVICYFACTSGAFIYNEIISFLKVNVFLVSNDSAYSLTTNFTLSHPRKTKMQVTAFRKGSHIACDLLNRVFLRFQQKTAIGNDYHSSGIFVDCTFGYMFVRACTHCGLRLRKYLEIKLFKFRIFETFLSRAAKIVGLIHTMRSHTAFRTSPVHVGTCSIIRYLTY